MRPTKKQMNNHERSMELIESDKSLSHLDKLFIFDNYLPFADGERVDNVGTFFTPWQLAHIFSLNSYDIVENTTNTIVDICAGIGMLTYAQVADFGYPQRDWWKWYEITCVELNPRYVEIGKRILPEANWICADVFDKSTWERLQAFSHPYDHAISNPPFGIKVEADTSWLNFQGDSELMIAEIATRIAHSNTLILPQISVHPFWQRTLPKGMARETMSKRWSKEPDTKVQKFIDKTGLRFEGVNFTTEFAQDLWKGTGPVVEIIHIE